MPTSLDEKKITAKNNENELISARVIANYGDPGLDEDYQFDILSRYVIVAIESVDRIPTSDKWTKMIAVVQRPQELWIDVVGAQTPSPSDQQRMDNLGNTNVGLSSNYSVNAIARINNPYQLGEVIYLKRLATPLFLTSQQQDSIFQSKFTSMPSTQLYYNNWHNIGSDLAYIQNGNYQNNLRLKTVAFVNNAGSSFFYCPQLNKYQYEAFSLKQNTNNAVKQQGLSQIFAGQWRGYGQVYNANGGYIFTSSQNLTIPAIEFEDANVGQKMRVGSNDCIPLIVTSPSQFPTPKSRSSGTINYSPTVVPVSS